VRRGKGGIGNGGGEEEEKEVEESDEVGEDEIPTNIGR
jgi:hypothetical protein